MRSTRLVALVVGLFVLVVAVGVSVLLEAMRLALMFLMCCIVAVQ